MHDLWIIGDLFLHDVIGELEARKHATARGQKERELPLYMQEHFNVHGFHEYNWAGLRLSSTRIINNLIQAIEQWKRLPKYLLVITDWDPMRDIDVSDKTAPAILFEVVR